MSQPPIDDVNDEQLLKDVRSMIDSLKDDKIYSPVYALLPGYGFVNMTSEGADSELLQLRGAVIDYWKNGAK